MTKKDAVNYFGSVSELARAIGVTPSAVNQWTNELSLSKQDQIRGACLRLGKPVPQSWLKAS